MRNDGLSIGGQKNFVNMWTPYGANIFPLLSARPIGENEAPERVGAVQAIEARGAAGSICNNLPGIQSRQFSALTLKDKGQVEYPTIRDNWNGNIDVLVP